MAKDALIKVRCSQELKDRLTALAAAKEQSLSDYLRTRIIDDLQVNEPQASYQSRQKKTRKAG